MLGCVLIVRELVACGNYGALRRRRQISLIIYILLLLLFNSFNPFNSLASLTPLAPLTPLTPLMLCKLLINKEGAKEVKGVKGI